MKKISKIIMMFFLISTLSIGVIAKNDEFIKEGDNEKNNTYGIVLSKEDFNKTMVGEKYLRHSLDSCNSYNKATLDLANIEIENNKISFDLLVKYSDVEHNISASGNLFASYKTQRGVNSTVVNFESVTDNYKILLFEIFNDKANDNLLVNDTINGKPHIKIYLMDDDKNIILFEKDLPKEFVSLTNNNLVEGDSKYDAYWFLDIVNKSKVKTLKTNDKILSKLKPIKNATKSLNSFSTWTNDTTYYCEFYVGNELSKCWSLPYLEYKHVNVTPQDSTWIASFKVAEHTQIGTYTYYGNNVFEYRNVELKFACGAKSTFVQTLQQGKMYDYTSIKNAIKKTGDMIATTLFKKALSKIPYGTTLNEVLGYFNTLTSSNGNVKLGNDSITLYNRKTVAVGQKLSKYKFEECTDHSNKLNNGDYFTYQAMLQYESPDESSVDTVGALQLKFDVFNYHDYSSTPIEKSFPLNYTAKSH